MSLDVKQFRKLIYEVLARCNWYSVEAEELQIGIAAHESHFGTYLEQVGGPALGFFQMEPATEKDIWDSYLYYRPHHKRTIRKVCGVIEADPWSLKTNLAYQIAIARVHLLRVKEPLPPAHDLKAQAVYWDKHWNRNPDKGFPAQYIADYNRYVGGRNAEKAPVHT